MGAPTVIDVPHKLGKEEARRRMQGRIGELTSHIPGGQFARVETSWPKPDEMALGINALGQQLKARLEVMEQMVRVHLDLPPMLAGMAGIISSAIGTKGAEILLEDKSKR